MISRKKLDINIWDLIEYNNEKVYYMPYNNIMKFQIKTRYCLKCSKELKIRFRKNEFVSNHCSCSNNGLNYATVEELLTIFSKEEAEKILQKFSDNKTRKLKNRKKYWLDLGYNNIEAEVKVSNIQKKRSDKSPSSQKGARGYSIRTKEYWIKHGYTDEEAGYKVLRISEKEFKENPKDTIQKCKRFLNED